MQLLLQKARSETASSRILPWHDALAIANTRAYRAGDGVFHQYLLAAVAGTHAYLPHISRYCTHTAAAPRRLMVFGRNGLHYRVHRTHRGRVCVSRGDPEFTDDKIWGLEGDRLNEPDFRHIPHQFPWRLPVCGGGVAPVLEDRQFACAHFTSHRQQHHLRLPKLRQSIFSGMADGDEFTRFVYENRAQPHCSDCQHGAAAVHYYMDSSGLEKQDDNK